MSVSGSFCEVFDEVDLVQVRLVPQADELGEADLVPQGPVENGDAQRAGLGKEGDPALRQHASREGGVHIVACVDQAEAVGAEDADAPFSGDVLDPLLQERSFGARFLEPGAQDHRRFDAGG